MTEQQIMEIARKRAAESWDYYASLHAPTSLTPAEIAERIECEAEGIADMLRSSPPSPSP